MGPVLDRKSATLFVQFPEVWGSPDPDWEFREGFHTFVSRHGRPGDTAIIFEPNPWRLHELRALWSDWPSVEFLPTDVGLGEGQSRTYFWCDDEPLPRHHYSPFAEDIYQRFPGKVCQEAPVATVDVGAIVRDFSATHGRVVVSVDIRRDLPPDLKVITWLSEIADLVLTSWVSESSEEAVQADAALRHGGLIRAGRPWGAAGTGRRFVRTRAPFDAICPVVQESKVQLGQAVVRMRARLGSPEAWRARRLKSRLLLGLSLSRKDVLDDHWGVSLPAAPVVWLRTLTPKGADLNSSPWSVDISECDPLDIARECADRHGVWPVSFSFPGSPLPLLDSPEMLISPITPGLPLTFDNSQDYLASYQNAFFGITHRKAGWDCFRHVEILASGAIPLMPDAQDIPRYSMIHYPKLAMASVARIVGLAGGPPDKSTRLAFRLHFERHLSSKAMAQYILQASGLQAAQRVLFVDEQLPSYADYQSVMTLIGLKQVLGSGCISAFPVDYVYEDSRAPIDGLYGRGFGYTKVLSENARSPEELRSGWDLKTFDAVVVGSISRNSAVAEHLLTQFPAHRTVWIHGEDTPPLPGAVRRMRSSGAHLFVRAIHTGSSRPAIP